jgi:hypothetical protein
VRINMSRTKFEDLPKDLRVAAERAGVADVLWLVGPVMQGEVELDRTLDEVVIAARGHRARGITVTQALEQNTAPMASK